VFLEVKAKTGAALIEGERGGYKGKMAAATGTLSQ